MSLKDIGIGKKEFDMEEKPWKIPWYFKFLEKVVLLYFDVISGGIKIIKHNMKKIEGPYILLQNHASFVDFGVTLKATSPKTPYWVASIEEFMRSEWLMRSLGCIYKRKFTADIRVVKHILYTLKTLKQNVTIFPEARFSLVGINEETDAMSYARLVKIAKVPLVIGINKGVFIRSPQWCKHPYRKIKLIGDYTQVVTKEESYTLSKEEIAERINNLFKYDDYKYWQDSKTIIKCKKRAEGLHKVLYKCPHCGKEFEMDSKGTKIWCNNCGHVWELTETGFLQSLNGETYFNHVPDWYKWERECVKKEVENDTYSFSDDVKVRQLIKCSNGLEYIGKMKLTHDKNGFTLKGKTTKGEDFTFNRTVDSMYSCHIEFNLIKLGEAIDLATQDKTYFVFPQNLKNRLTKIHFATEELYKKYKKN